MNTKLNRSDFIVLFIFYTVSTSINIYRYYKNDNFLIEYLADFPVEIMCSFALIYIFIAVLIPSFIVKKQQYFLFALLALISLIVFGMIAYTVGHWSGDNDWSKYPRGISFILEGINDGSDLVAFPLGVLLTKKFYEGQNQLIQVKEQQKGNELKLLRSQLDPHFLFNNLNTLDSLIDFKPKEAKEYISRLSLIYRYLIRTKDAEVMELHKEIEFAKNYVFLIKTRFVDDYNFSFLNDELVEDKFIPTGALQTLLENVVKHNKVLAKNTVETTIVIKEDYLVVTNSKSNSGKNSESFGTGLKNLKMRYELLIDKQVEVVDTSNEYKVSIPTIKLSNEK